MSNPSNPLVPIAVVAAAAFMALGIAFAGGSHGAQLNGVPVFVWVAIIAFAINWLAYIPAYLAQTEHYYDLTGSFTYLVCIVFAIRMSPELDLRGSIVAILVIIWALRLGTFLFARIRRDGKDDRFDKIKPSALRFLIAWTLQALWVVLTAACAFAVITSSSGQPLGAVAWLGISIWVFGFVIEVVADNQKSNFKKNPNNRGRFIDSGLWSWSRHPNYFGEMVLWAGIALIALPILEGWQYLCLISPLFVYALITHISGVNKLEQKAEQKWGDDPDYQQYKKQTSRLLLLPPSQ